MDEPRTPHYAAADGIATRITLKTVPGSWQWKNHPPDWLAELEQAVERAQPTSIPR